MNSPKHLAIATTVWLWLCAFGFIINQNVFWISDVYTTRADYANSLANSYKQVDSSLNIQNNWVWWNYDANGKKTWPWRETDDGWYRLLNYKDWLENGKASYFSNTETWVVQNQNYVNGVMQWAFEYISADGYRILWNVSNGNYDGLWTFYDPNWLTINVNYSNWNVIWKWAAFQNWAQVITFSFLNWKVDDSSIQINNRNNDPELSQRFNSSLYYFSNYFASSVWGSVLNNTQSDNNSNINSNTNASGLNNMQTIIRMLDEGGNGIWNYNANWQKTGKWVLNTDKIYAEAQYSNWQLNWIMKVIYNNNFVMLENYKNDKQVWDTLWYFRDWTKVRYRYADWVMNEMIMDFKNWIIIDTFFWKGNGVSSQITYYNGKKYKYSDDKWTKYYFKSDAADKLILDSSLKFLMAMMQN